MDGLRPKGYAGTADHPGGCPGQNILEIKKSYWEKANKKKIVDSRITGLCITKSCESAALMYPVRRKLLTFMCVASVMLILGYPGAVRWLSR